MPKWEAHHSLSKEALTQLLMIYHKLVDSAEQLQGPTRKHVEQCCKGWVTAHQSDSTAGHSIHKDTKKVLRLKTILSFEAHVFVPESVHIHNISRNK